MPFQFDNGNKEESNINSFSSDDDDVVSEVNDDELNQMVKVCFELLTFNQFEFSIIKKWNKVRNNFTWYTITYSIPFFNNNE